MTKRILAVILSIVILLGINVTSFAAGYTVDFVIDAPSSAVTAGDVFNVVVGVDNMKDHILSGTIQLVYDADMLECVSVTAIGDDVDNYIESSAFCNTVNTEEAGRVVVGFFSINDCPEDFVRIMTVEFRAKKTGKTDVEVLNFNDWSDEYKGASLWFSDTDGFPEFTNNKKTITVAAFSSDYKVEYVIDQPSEIYVGKEFTVGFAVKNMKDHILTCTLEFEYDTEMLELKDCRAPGTSEDGNIFNDSVNNYMYVINKETAGTVILTFISIDECKSDEVELIEFTFVAKDTGVAQVEITSDDWEDVYEGNTLWCIESTNTVPEGLEQTLMFTIEEEKPVDIMLGDLSGDRKITAADARIALRAAAKIDTLTPEQQQAADVTKDGKINASDARMILRVAAKIDDFENPVPPTPTPPPTPPVDTTPKVTLKANTTHAYLDKGGTAIIDIEVIGDLDGRDLIAEYDTSTFRVVWEENRYVYTETGNDVAVLYVSPLKYTSAKTIKVYVEGYENKIYTTFTVSASSDGWYDYGGFAGAVDYGAYTRVAPHFCYMSEEADSVAFFYSLSDLAAAGYTAEVLLTDFFTYLESYGYSYVDYHEDSTSLDYLFYSSKYDIDYVYSLIYDDYGDVTDIMILLMI